MARQRVRLLVNGKQVERDVELRLLLVDFLRDGLELTGTHVGCTYEGVCGACTVHLNGAAVKSCMMLAVQANGQEVTTIEGLGSMSEPHPLQTAFRERHALQCGFCTAGMIMNLAEFLTINPAPSESDIRHAIVGNLCRCTGYSHIVEAVQDAAATLGRGLQERHG